MREPDGKWFASLVFEEVVPLQNIDATSIAVQRRRSASTSASLSLITTSDGEKVEHPRFLRKAEKRLKHLQQQPLSQEEGFQEPVQGHDIESHHSTAKVRRQRLDFNHKLSTRLVRRHDFIAFEDLKIKNMVKNHRLAKSIQRRRLGPARQTHRIQGPEGRLKGRAGSPQLIRLRSAPIVARSTRSTSTLESSSASAAAEPFRETPMPHTSC